ncbi:MAG: DUF2721 domain-containing protein [Betaproteobacteria bacterium]|nr:DUF2721 domain-containing protein [Betaproteobacteria bacterium]
MVIEHHVPAIAAVIQLAVAPVFMLTAVGTIINALNSRLGRAIDRRRALENLLAGLKGDEAASAHGELEVVARRIRLVYLAILCSVFSALFICLLIAGAFIGAFVAIDLSGTIASMFVLGIFALVACLLIFLREIFVAVNTPRHVPLGGRARALHPPPGG